MAQKNGGEAPGKDASPLRRQNSFRRFLMLNQDAAKEIQVGDIRLNGTETRVLFALLNNAMKTNIIMRSQKFMSIETGISAPNFNRAMAALHEHGYWARCPEEGQMDTIMVSPYKAWKGDALKHDKAKEEFDRWRQLEKFRDERRRERSRAKLAV